MSPPILVPTMGALHEGHRSLIRRARQLGGPVAVSVFVNPTQFGANEDFTRYPRPLDADLAICREEGVDLVFNPAVDEMYPPGQTPLALDLPQLTQQLEGRHRPGHFKGVCQVVAKLFNIIQPRAAVFGLKDYQQWRVLSAMVEALNWPIDMIPAPTLRDPDGMAMSSRNAYLSPDERARARSISQALFIARDQAAAGIVQTNRLVATMQKVLLDPGELGRVHVRIDYVAAVDAATLQPVDIVSGPTVLLIAARVGNTRLIDNVVVGQPSAQGGA